MHPQEVIEFRLDEKNSSFSKKMRKLVNLARHDYKVRHAYRAKDKKNEEKGFVIFLTKD